MEIVKTYNLKKYFGEGKEIVKALDGVDLSIEKGKFTPIVGASGSGKTTLLNLIGGLYEPTQGSVIVDGIDLSKLTEEQNTVFRRRKAGFVFQDFRLIPELNVRENICFPLLLDRSRADEPTGSFDIRTSQNVAGLLKMTTENFHQTLIMITHNNDLAQLADRVVRLEDGRIAE